MSPLKAKALSVALALAAAVPATVHAVTARLEERRSKRELAELTAAIEPIATAAPGARRVMLNGALMIFRTSTEQGSVDDVLANTARECESADEEIALGVPASAERSVHRPIRLERVVVADSASGARASLCVFAPAGPEEAPQTQAQVAPIDMTPSAPSRRVRYTLARREEDGRTMVTTVSAVSSTPLSALFPAEGDAPGSDAPGVARPEQARRTLTAIVGADEHVVRVYESPLRTEAAVESYDKAMVGLGFETTASLPDARMYRQRNGASYVASFRGNAEGCTVTIAPFTGVLSSRKESH